MFSQFHGTSILNFQCSASVWEHVILYISDTDICVHILEIKSFHQSSNFNRSYFDCFIFMNIGLLLTVGFSPLLNADSSICFLH